jgi:hypothetical protein
VGAKATTAVAYLLGIELVTKSLIFWGALLNFNDLRDFKIAIAGAGVNVTVDVTVDVGS